MHPQENQAGNEGSSEVTPISIPEIALLEMMPDAIVIADPAGSIVFANAQAERMFDYTQTELLSLKLESLMPARFRETHHAHREQFRSKPDLRTMGSGLDLYGLTKSGTEFPVDISVGPFLSGGRTLAIAAIRDISELKNATDALLLKIRELADFKAALDEHAILAITDPKGRITYANDKFCAISQYSREELLGQDHRMINSGYHSKEFWAQAWATLASGQVWKGEVRNRAKDGSFYWVDATIVPFFDQWGLPSQYVAIRTEITAIKNAEQERERLVEELRRAQAQVKILGG